MALESSELRPSDFLNAKGRFKCSMCVNTYRHFKHLKRHLNSHTHEVVYECDDCGRRFSRGDLLQRHRRKCAMSEDENAPSYRMRRTRARRASSMSSSNAGDSDISDSFSRTSDSEYAYSRSEPHTDVPFVRRSGRHTAHPQTYDEDTLTTTHETQDTTTQPLTVAELQQHPRQHLQRQPGFPPLNFPQRNLDQPDNFENNTDWFTQLQEPQTPSEPSQPYFHPEQSGYENGYYSDLSSTEPGWLAPIENDTNNMDFSNPVSPAWEPVDNRQYGSHAFPPVDQKLPTDMYSELYLKDPAFDPLFIDQDSFSNPIIPLDTDFPECTSDFQWSKQTSSFVY